MIGGQVIDLANENNPDVTIDTLQLLDSLKTGALIEAACVMGCIVAGANEDEINAARVFACKTGLAFQIKDDILDYSGTESVGKPLGVDILEQKITMPLLGALANAPAEEDRIRGLVKGIVDNPANRDEIVAFVKENAGLEYAVQQLDKYVARAVEALAVLPSCVEKVLLQDLAYFTAKRVM